MYKDIGKVKKIFVVLLRLEIRRAFEIKIKVRSVVKTYILLSKFGFP